MTNDPESETDWCSLAELIQLQRCYLESLKWPPTIEQRAEVYLACSKLESAARIVRYAMELGNPVTVERAYLLGNRALAELAAHLDMPEAEGREPGAETEAA
jgi:hypothetical protein